MLRRFLPIAAVLLASLALVGPVRAASFSDDFESDAVGTSPAGWGDVRNLALPNAPLPSAVVVATTDALGNPTQAVQTVDALSPSLGIFRPIAPAAEHQLSGDVRIDRFATPGADATVVSSWPVLFGVADLLVGSDVCCYPTSQVAVYVSTLTKGFRLFSTDGAGHTSDIDLGASAEVDSWYHVELDLQVSSGTVRSRILNASNQSVLVDETDVIPGWTPANFDAITFFAGEIDSSTASGIGSLDRVDYASVPEPGTFALSSLGLVGVAAWGRRRRHS